MGYADGATGSESVNRVPLWAVRLGPHATVLRTAPLRASQAQHTDLTVSAHLQDVFLLRCQYFTPPRVPLWHIDSRSRQVGPLGVLRIAVHDVLRAGRSDRSDVR